MRTFPGSAFFAVSLAVVAITSHPERVDAQLSSNMNLLSNLDSYAGYSDIWGYTHTNGAEYALLGVQTGVSVVNITDPYNPYEAGFITAGTSDWQDIKTYQTYAYVVMDVSGTGRMTIIDLSDPENPSLAGTYGASGFKVHNIYVDNDTGRLYTAGANVSNGGTRILSLANPTAPVEIGSWEGNYLHDVMVQDGVLYGSSIYDGILYILDVSNPASISTLGTISGYSHAFTHNAWVTADGQYVMTTDETTGAACRLWDISNPASASQTDLYLPNPSTIPHNTHIDGDLAIISHYTLGVRVVDISDPNNITETGYYDTYPASNGGGYSGCWGAFPFFPNSPNRIIASDQSNGLFVLDYVPPVTGAPTVDRRESAAWLSAAAPNPFRAGETTTLSYSLPEPGSVTAGVYDVRGRRVARLAAGERAAGSHLLRWNGLLADGAPAPAGTYFVRLQTSTGTLSRKLVTSR